MSIRIERLVKEFRDPGGRIVRAVDDVSLEVAQSEIVTLLGPSGCGKTTTLRMIAGFETPTSGEVFIADERMTDRAPHERDTPMVFQSYALFPHLSVRENAVFGLSMRKIEKVRANARVEELASGMGLGELLDRSPHALSGGQQQRVALLRALVTEPKVLLFDEPLSNLDARLRVAMRTEIRRIQRRSRITAIWVTHDQEEAMVMSDRIVVMERGRIAQSGPPREVYARPATRFVASFLGDATFIEASIVGIDGAIPITESVLGRVPADGVPFRLGAQITLVVRPEQVRLARATSGATIKTVTFLGAEVRYEAALGEQLILARALVAAGGAPLEEGDTAAVSIDPTPLHAIAAS
jgi:iron(III) transport system ATP-binding protein